MSERDPEAFRRMVTACALKPHTVLMSADEPARLRHVRMALWLLEHEFDGKAPDVSTAAAQWGDLATEKGRAQFKAALAAGASRRETEYLTGDERGRLQRQHNGASELESAGYLDEAGTLFGRLLDRLLTLQGEFTEPIGACYLHLGQIAHRAKRVKKARTYYEACLELVPNHRRARRHLKALGASRRQAEPR
jgi:tetratricopeptide (TPR) repeat protein